MLLNELFDILVDKGYEMEWCVGMHQFRIKSKNGYVYVQRSIKPGHFFISRQFEDPVEYDSIHHVLLGIDILTGRKSK